MKKTAFIAAAAIAFIISGYTANADVLYEPPPDTFYDQNRDSITRINGKGRVYIVSQDADILSRPEGENVGTVHAGETPALFLFYTDESGRLWGGYFHMTDYGSVCWICLEKAELVYDNISFNEEHGSEIRNADTDEFEYLEASKEPIYLWKYPGSQKYSRMKSYPPAYGKYIYSVYTDEKGGVWGYVPYIWGLEGWIFTNDPHTDNPDPSAIITEAVQETAPETTAETSAETTPETATETSPETTAETSAETISETATETSPETTTETTTESETTSEQTLSGTTPAPEIQTTPETTAQTVPETTAANVVYEEKKSSPLVLPALLTAAAAAVSVILIKLLGRKK